MSTFPGIEEVRAIAAMADGAERNARITAAYFRLSAEVADRVAPCANWCTFAAWASRQAGVTIRHEDLLELVRIRLGQSGPGRELAAAVADRARGTKVDLPALVVRKLGELGPLQRSGEAVARGNQKVFDEIGYEFARFLATMADLRTATDAEFEGFIGGLREGESPDGQEMLRQAFRCYRSAAVASSPSECAQWVLLANLSIGFHEQVRLQPEIRAAMDGAAFRPGDLADLLMQDLGRWEAGWRRMLRRAVPFYVSPVERLARAVSEDVAAVVRRVATEHLMTLSLGSVRLRLGADVPQPYSASLAALTNPALIELVGRIDPVAGTSAGSGAIDWADLAQRMHFIGELFRAYQEDAVILVAPPP